MPHSQNVYKVSIICVFSKSPCTEVEKSCSGRRVQFCARFVKHNVVILETQFEEAGAADSLGIGKIETGASKTSGRRCMVVTKQT